MVHTAHDVYRLHIMYSGQRRLVNYLLGLSSNKNHGLFNVPERKHRLTWRNIIIAELADRSPITIQNGSSNPSSRKNLDLRPHDRPYKVLLLTCVVNCTAGTPMPWLCTVVQWSVHWAPSRTTRVLILAGARHCALETCEKKMRAPFLGLAKSIYYTELKFKIRAVLMVTFSWLASWRQSRELNI